MALTTDAEFLIHMMRIKFLRMDDRGERIMSFPPTVMSDDYVRLAAPRYPEMQYCYSPAYDMNGSKDNPIFGTSLISSPRTKRTQYRPRKKTINTDDVTTTTVTAAGGGGGNNDLKHLATTNTKSPSALTSSRFDSSSDSDDDVETEFGINQYKRRPTLDSVVRNNKTTQDDTITIFSQGGTSELTTSASLHPSMESNIDPSPRSSLDVIDANTQENSLPFMQVASIAPRASLDTSRYSKPNVFSPPPVPPPKTTITTTSATPLPPAPPLTTSTTNTNSNTVNNGLVPLGNGPSHLQTRRQQQQQQQQQQQSPFMIPPTTSSSSTTTTISTPSSSSPPPVTQDTSSTLQPSRRYHIIPGKSALSAMIAAKASSAENPFSEYAHASGKGSSHPITLCVYLPHSTTPSKPVSLVVRPDAIIDDVIGYILYDYVEQKRMPELDQEVYDLAQWLLLIAEDDGEIEDDLPAPDRTRRIDMVNFDQYALCRANPSQAKQNEQIRAKLGRSKPDLESLNKKPSMVLGPTINGTTSTTTSSSLSSSTAATAATAAIATTTTTATGTNINGTENNHTLLAPNMSKGTSGSVSHSASSNGDIMMNTTVQPSTNQLLHLPSLQHQQMETSPSTTTPSMTTPTGMPMTAADTDSSSIAVPVPSSKAVLTKAALPMTPIKYFRIRLMTSEEVAATTTIPVSAEMFIGDVLELVSRKRKLDPNEYILTISDSNVVISNDTAVQYLKDVEELTLTKKGNALTVPPSSSNPLWRSPIKKRKEDTHAPMYFNTGDINKQPSDNFLQQYKKYNVNRKTPMFVGKRVSVLAIDGNYIHLMPPEHKGMFDSVKTTSFHVSAIRSCKQSKKVPSNFKIGVMKERDYKTYELEAETSKEAYEICARIRFLIQMNKGSGTL